MVKLTQVKARSFGLKCFKLFYFLFFICVDTYICLSIYIYIYNIDQKKYQLSGFIYPSVHDIQIAFVCPVISSLLFLSFLFSSFLFFF